MLLLALDTSGPTVSVALHDGTRVVATATGQGAMAHGELLAPGIRDVLSQGGVTPADLTDVAVGVGPGPFTGLRVGVVTARTLAATLGLAAHGVCSLDVVAHAVRGVYGDVLVATDARRKEVYWARYVDGERVVGPEVDRPADLAARHPNLPVVGRGASLYPDLLSAAEGPADAQAADLARAVVAGVATEVPLEPLYLRRPDAVVPGLPKRA